MPQYIALLRGINVGGHGRLPMAELREIMGEQGATQVRTYIQSGNVVFDSKSRSAAKLSKVLEDAIEDAKGFRPSTQVWTAAAFGKVAAENPFPKAATEMDGKALHVSFLASAPKTPKKGIEQVLEEAAGPGDRFALSGRAFYLHTPKGLSKSKLATKVERILGVPATSRNWRSVQAILDLCGS